MLDRALLAARLRKGSWDSVGRALKELVAAGAVAVKHPSGPRAKPGPALPAVYPVTEAGEVLAGPGVRSDPRIQVAEASALSVRVDEAHQGKTADAAQELVDFRLL